MPDHKTIGRGFKNISEETGAVRQSRSRMVINPVSFYMQAGHTVDIQRLVIFLQEGGQQAVAKNGWVTMRSWSSEDCLYSCPTPGPQGFWRLDRKSWGSPSMTPPDYLAGGPLKGKKVVSMGLVVGGQ